MRRVVYALPGVLVIALAGGCGGSDGPDAAQVQRQGHDKVKAMEQIAEALQKGNMQEAVGALESFRSIPFNPDDYPQEKEQIVQIYKTKVQPKAKGEFAAELKGEMAPYLKGK
jgi:hypothetical protein